MAFQPGNPGKPKGANSILTRQMRAMSQEMGIDPFQVLLYFAAGDWKALGYKSEMYVSSADKNGTYEKFTIDPSVRCKAAAEAVQYIAPKLRSIEHATSDQLQDMTPQQKLEALENAATIIRDKLKSGGHE